MLIFKKVRFKNLMSYGNTWTEVTLDSHDSTLIIGKNGMGKSTILEAITFGLYGKSYRKIKKEQLVNTINEKDCVVEVYFEVNNGSYMVRRGIKPVIFEVFYNGTLMNQDNKNRDYQKILEQQIVKMSYRTFTQMVVLGAAKYVPFMALPTWQRREFTEELLDLSIFSVIAAIVKETIGEHKVELTELQTKIKLVKNSIDENKEFLSHIQSNKDSQILEFEKDLLEAEARIQETDQKLADVQNDMKGLPSDEEVAALKDDLDELNGQIREKASIIAKDSKEIKFYHDHDHCPTCAQTIDAKFKTHVCSSLDDRVTKATVSREKLKEQYDVLLQSYNDVLSRVNEVKSKHIKVLTESQSHNSIIVKIKKRIEKLRKTEDGSYSSYQEKLDELIKTFQECEASYKKGIAKLKYFDLCLRLSSDTGIKAKIIQTYLPMLNTLINKYLAMMDFYVSFYLDENFDETIKSRYRDNFTYGSFSEGEASRLNLGLLFSFLELAKIKNSIQTNLLFMDELFDSSMDQEGVEFVSKLLKDADMNVFVISHNDRLRDKFQRCLLAEKHGNFSVLDEI